MSIKLTVLSEIEQIAEQHQKTLAPLTDDSILMNTGLDSLCFAVLVARLEDRLGVDPFSASDDISFPVTLGDFVRVYENAAR
ncbi:MAG TPA: phosphopantetheine-binding protein [Xanthobacteraceae bacterium]|jgi:acyl carrier protein|nr:phosphopantetheine-binding protein [Xanthobacteraceae bacterium]